MANEGDFYQQQLYRLLLKGEKCGSHRRFEWLLDNYLSECLFYKKLLPRGAPEPHNLRDPACSSILRL